LDWDGREWDLRWVFSWKRVGVMRYLAVIHKDSDSDYGVTIPDLPGCFSAGVTIDEALEMAREAILCHVEGLLVDEEMILVPLPIETHQQNPDYRNELLIEIDPWLQSVSTD
jgi:predicted RNase H-like HicB family nuclease